MINFLGELNIKVPIPENDEKQFGGGWSFSKIGEKKSERGAA